MPSMSDDNDLVKLFQMRQRNALMRCMLALGDGFAAAAKGDGKTAALCFLKSSDERKLMENYGPEIEAAKMSP